MGDPMIAVRAIHFASTIIVAGTVLFSILVAGPAWQTAKAPSGEWIEPFKKRIGLLLWVSLIVAVLSGTIWLVLVAIDISAEPWAEVIGDGIAWIVLTQTQFGWISQIRLLLAGIIALLLLSQAWRKRRSSWLCALSVIVAMLLLGSLAWTGHAAGAVGVGGSVHLVSDTLHVLAAGAWIGGLIPLALLMAQLSQKRDAEGMAVCDHVLRRFSSRLGVVSVAAILLSGIINTWFLTDQLRGLTGTAYGQLVQLKSGLFIAMISLAADNRVRLVPRLSRSDDEGKSRALAQLRRNIVLEIALAMIVIYVVGVLGVTPPANHIHAAWNDAAVCGPHI